MARIPKNVSLCPKTHAIAQNMLDFSAFVRHILNDPNHVSTIQALEEVRAILKARTDAFRKFEDQITRAYNNRDMPEVKKALIGRGLI